MSDFTYFLNQLIFGLKTEQKTIWQEKLRTTWHNGKLHGSMTLEIYIFAQLWNSFPEELKTITQKIIYINVTEDLFVKKKTKTINIKIAKQISIMLKSKSLLILPAKKTKITKASWGVDDNKIFRFRNDLLWTELGGNYFLCTKTFQRNE